MGAPFFTAATSLVKRNLLQINVKNSDSIETIIERLKKMKISKQSHSAKNVEVSSNSLQNIKTMKGGPLDTSKIFEKVSQCRKLKEGPLH